MTTKEAERLYRQCINKSVLTPDEEFMMTEALEFLIEETKQTKWMVLSADTITESVSSISLSNITRWRTRGKSITTK